MWVNKGSSAGVAPSGTEPLENECLQNQNEPVLGQGTLPVWAQPALCFQRSSSATMYQPHRPCFVSAACARVMQPLMRDFKPQFSAFWLQINNAFLAFQVHSQNILSSGRLMTSCAEEIFCSLRNWWVSYSFWTDWLVLNIHILHFHTVLAKRSTCLLFFLRQRNNTRWM